MEEIRRVVQEYYKQCLLQNLQNTEYAPNRSIAGLGLVGWFQSLWRDSAFPREYLVRLKMMLRDLLVHLFERPEIADFFADWKSDARLGRAFESAMDWAKDHRPSSVPQN